MRTGYLLLAVICIAGCLAGALSCSSVECGDARTCGSASTNDGGGPDGTIVPEAGASDSSTDVDAQNMGDAVADASEASDGFVCDPSKTPSEEACVVADGFGLFVSPTGSDTVGAGTKENPYATVGYALTHLGSMSRIYLCNGSFHETGTVRVLSPMGLFGGLACPSGTSSDWSYVDGGAASITMAPDQVALEIVGVSGAVDVEDLALSALPAVGMDDAGNGWSSVAVVVDHSNVTFRRCTMNAGNGADGADGGAASNYAGAPNAPNGQAGDDAGNGGAGGLIVCADRTSSMGGVGGIGTLTIATNGGDGGAVPMPPVNGAQGFDGLGGNGSSARCTPGDLGANGLPGSGGAAADAGAYGMWTDGGWLPSAGAAGGSGNPGQGGGGGGGQRVLPGTGGGSGGCGGAGGRGGGGGGASFALVCLSSSVTLDACALMTGRGGHGGNGSDGQPGQGGGAPGTPPLTGCPGNFGGNGAGGAGGAGGTGGSSACIVYQGTPPSGTPTCGSGAPGTGGAGGRGASGGDTVPDRGNPGAAGPNGADGGAGASQARLGL